MAQTDSIICDPITWCSLYLEQKLLNTITLGHIETDSVNGIVISLFVIHKVL